jgi:hypothetical protein
MHRRGRVDGADLEDRRLEVGDGVGRDPVIGAKRPDGRVQVPAVRRLDEIRLPCLIEIGP